MTTLQRGSPAEADRPPEVDSVGAEVAERLRVVLVSGAAVGLVVAGIGSRLAMMLLRATSPDDVRGVTSDDGFEIGQVTLAGTYSLLAVGVGFGILGAAAYRLVAPWLIGPVWFRRLTTAAGSGAVVGSMLVHTDGIDFRLLEPTWLAIGTFVALPALFGFVIAVVADRVAAPGSWTARGRRRWLVPLVLLVPFPQVAVLAVPFGLAVLLVWVPVRRVAADGVRRSAVLGVAVRAVWLVIAVVGLSTLLADISELT